MSYATLLVVLALLVFLSPVLGDAGYGAWVVYALSPAMLAAAAVAASESRATTATALGLVIALVGLEILRFVKPAAGLFVAERALNGVFVVYVVFVLLRHIMSRRVVTSDTIMGAICVYLLIGVCFYNVYCIAMIQDPGAFLQQGAPLVETGSVIEGRFPTLIYFSFVTLTSLGYGDVAPARPLVRSLATFEAVLGQLFLAVMVARLVGSRLAQRHHHEHDG